MNTDILVASQFRRYMNNPLPEEPKCIFESLVLKLRSCIEAGEPFNANSKSYLPFMVAESGYEVNEYCKKDTEIIESLIREELEKRGLLNQMISEDREYSMIDPGTYVLRGKRIVLASPLPPIDSFLGYPIYRHGDQVFTAEGLQKENGAVAPTNNVGSGNIAGVSPGQEPPGRRGKFFRRNLEDTKKLKKKIKKRVD
jgi:hypothetical protein